MRGSYLHHKEIKAAQGVKIAAQNLETAVAGTQMLVAGPNDDIEVLKAEVMEDMKDIFGSVDRSGKSLSIDTCTQPLPVGVPACRTGSRQLAQANSLSSCSVFSSSFSGCACGEQAQPWLCCAI